MFDRQVRLRFVLAVFALITFLFIGSLAYVMSNPGSSTVTLESGSFAKGYTFIVLVDGSTYKAFNGTTASLATSGTNDDTVIQYAIDQTSTNGGSVFVMSGSYSASVTLKDGVTLILDKGASTITVTIDSGADATLVDYENGFRKEWVAGSLYTFMDLRTGEFWWQGQNKTDVLVNPLSESSYVVDKSGSLYRMKNMTTGQIDWSSTDASAIHEACFSNLTGGGIVFTRNGDYTITSTIDITNDNITWIMESWKTRIICSTDNIKLLYVHGTSGDHIQNVIIKGGAFVSQQSGTTNLIGNIKFLYADYCTLENIYVYDSQDNALLFEECIGCEAKRCKIENAGHIEFGQSIQLKASNSCLVQANKILNGNGTGILVSTTSKGCYFNSIIDNYIDTSLDDNGIYLCDDNDAGCKFNIVKGNTITNMQDTAGKVAGGGAGIKLHGGSNILIDHNTVTANIIYLCDQGIFCSSHYNTFTANTITSLTGGRGVGEGIAFNIYGKYNVISGNTIWYVSEGVYFNTGADVNEFVGNQVYDVGSSFVASFAGSGKVNHVRDNVFQTTSDYYFYVDSGTLTQEGNVINNKPCENSGTATNSTATTFVFNHGLPTTATGVWASFDTTAISGWTWTSTSTQITITVTGTGLPESMTCYWTLEYKP